MAQLASLACSTLLGYFRFKILNRPLRLLPHNSFSPLWDKYFSPLWDKNIYVLAKLKYARQIIIHTYRA